MLRSVPTVTPAGELIGRDTEIARLAGFVQRVAGGEGASVLVEGEPGIGKSALIRAGLVCARASACDVFWGVGDELGQAIPLIPLLDGLRVREQSSDPRRATIVRILRGEDGADRVADVSAVLAEQLLALIAEQCTVRPAVLVVDDLQWADQASVALLARLARSVRQVPLLLIGAMRPVPQRDDLMTLRSCIAERIRLTGLTDTAAVQLVATLAGGRPDGGLWRLAAGAAGNPLYITELVAALTRGSSLTVNEAGIAELTGDAAPRSLSAAIADRLGFVSGSVREVLRAAALLGVDFAVPDLAIVLHRNVTDLVPVVNEACAAGVLAESGHALSFRHPLIRAALYQEIPGPVRAAWHRDAGRALAHAGAPADRVARQLLWSAEESDRSAEPMAEWMLTWLMRSAGQLIGQAPRVAAGLLSRAMVHSPPGTARHDTLTGRLADALYRAGDFADAEQVASGALSCVSEPDVLVDLHWTLAQCGMWTGQSSKALDELTQALDSPSISDRHRARLLTLAARTHINLGQVEKAGKVADTALAAATEAGDNWAMGWILHVLTIVTGVQGNLTEALQLSDRALAVTLTDPALTDLRLLLQLNKAVTLSTLDRYEEALATARQARLLAEQAGTLVRLAQAHTVLCEIFLDIGRWDDAMAEAKALPADLKEPAAACCDLGVTAVICFHRGEIAAAHRHLTAAAPYAERMGPRVVGPLAWARSLDHENDGALADALGELTAGMTDDTEELLEIEDLLPDAVRLAVRIGDLHAAEEFAEHAGALAAGSDIPRRQAHALYCRGLLDNDPAMLLQAAERYGDARRPLSQAKSLDAAAGIFVLAHDRDRARAAFSSSVGIYSSLGATHEVARLEATFRGHGIRRGPRAKHTKARSGWESLTPTEAKVAAHVEAGMSNPEIAAKLFLSPRTVATHVSHILKKLDMHTRTDIAREGALRTATSK
jgi:DNA-binding CsgD family transcriptional regulator/tetratricopeptide (TPR) repeat protein